MYFVDTNVLIYCYTATEPVKQAKALAAVLSPGRTVSTQVLQEFANVLRRKFNKDWSEIGRILAEVKLYFAVHINTPATLDTALRIADRYVISLYDSLIISAALEIGCHQLYSEDLHHGLIIDSKLTVINPFL